MEIEKVVESASNVVELVKAFMLPKNTLYLEAFNGFSVSHTACILENANVLKVFLDRYPRAVNQKLIHKDLTSLHLAVVYEAYNCCKVLLDRGADIYALSAVFQTPIDLAVAIDDVNILGLFMLMTDCICRPETGYESLRHASRMALEFGLLKQASSFAIQGAIFDLYDAKTGMNLLHLSCIKENPLLELLPELSIFDSAFKMIELDFSIPFFPWHITILKE